MVYAVAREGRIDSNQRAGIIPRITSASCVEANVSSHIAVLLSDAP
jgi:hypothetical protein